MQGILNWLNQIPWWLQQLIATAIGTIIILIVVGGPFWLALEIHYKRTIREWEEDKEKLHEDSDRKSKDSIKLDTPDSGC